MILLWTRTTFTADQTIEEVEAAHMMRKERVKRLDGRDSIRTRDKLRESLLSLCLTKGSTESRLTSE